MNKKYAQIDYFFFRTLKLKLTTDAVVSELYQLANNIHILVEKYKLAYFLVM